MKGMEVAILPYVASFVFAREGIEQVGRRCGKMRVKKGARFVRTASGRGPTPIQSLLSRNSREFPSVAQWLTNPTRNREVAGSIPGLAPGVKDPASP